VDELFKVLFQKFTLNETLAEEIMSQAPFVTVMVEKKYPVRRNSWENEWLLLKNANSLKSTE
jgi:hypothetical protein